jgi:hypothetical protein
MRGMRGVAWAGVIAIGGGIACKPDLRLGATGLQIVPDPAYQGQAVTGSFRLTIIPAHGYIVTLRIDDVVHDSVAGSGAFDGSFTMDVGNATDLIARYGAGVREAAVLVRLDDGHTARSSRTFTLEDAPPPP